MAATEINSDSLIDIEQNFIVKAGPGAGKTYWLIQHIKHVLNESMRLGKIKKIACITYTNIGVETICNRLSDNAGRVEVDTIHGFLYENIIKPYFYNIAEDEGFNLSKLRVIDDTVLTSEGTMVQLKKKIGKGYIYDDKDLKLAIKKARWTFQNKTLVFRPPYPMKSSKYTIPNPFYEEYKKYAWDKGVMHYDDILYFAYKLLVAYPFIAHVVGIKFPYIFIDEFQDSTPIQVEIIKQIASAADSVIGVIGDKSQAIYGFAGADSQLFDKFSVPRMNCYVIRSNRRSGKKIVDLLNYVRKDIQQISISNVQSFKPLLYIGDFISCHNDYIAMCDSNITTLSYDKVTVNSIRKNLGRISEDNTLLENIVDSNSERVKILICCINAIECGIEGAIKDALKFIKKFEDDERKQIHILRQLLNGYNSYKHQTMECFLNYLKETVGVKIAGLKEGKAKNFYSSTMYESLVLCLAPPETASISDKTIHKSKGDEFQNVMLVLKDEKELNFLTSPNLNGKDETHRVYYVAISRAIKNLAIYAPSLSNEMESLFSDIPINIKRL